MIAGYSQRAGRWTSTGDPRARASPAPHVASAQRLERPPHDRVRHECRFPIRGSRRRHHRRRGLRSSRSASPSAATGRGQRLMSTLTSHASSPPLRRNHRGARAARRNVSCTNRAPPRRFPTCAAPDGLEPLMMGIEQRTQTIDGGSRIVVGRRHRRLAGDHWGKRVSGRHLLADTPAQPGGHGGHDAS